MLGSLALVACKTPRMPPNAPGVTVWSSCDLPRDPFSNELSGIAWDESAHVAYVVQDKRPNIVTLVPDAELRTWQLGPHVPVDMKPPLDLEALALLRDGFVVASEHGPHIYELDRAERLRGEIPVPRSLRDARENKSLESIAVSPDGRFVFTANEGAAPADGPLANDDHGTRVRIARIDRATGAVTERTYMTDHAPREHGDYGVADLAALSSTNVLVLERGWAKGHGNSARIYRAALGEPESSKALIVDLAALDVGGLHLPTPNEPQPTPLLANFEGLAIGPGLPNGQGSLLLVSDDNTRSTQVARVLVLTWPK